MSTLDLETFRYQNILSNRQVLGTGFNGTIQFDYKLPSDIAISNLKDSYFVFNSRFLEDAGGVDPSLVTSSTDVTGATNMGFAQNPTSALFSTAEFRVNDVLTSRIESFSAHTVHNKLMNESYQQQLESTSPMLPYDNSVELVPVTVSGISPTVIGDVKVLPRVYINQKRINGNVIRTNIGGTLWSQNDIAVTKPYEVNMALPFPFMESVDADDDMTIMGNTKLTVIFQVSPTIFADLFANSPAGITNVNMDVSLFEWVIPTYKMENIPANVSMKRNFYETYSIRATNNQYQYQYQVPASARRIVVSFMQRSGVANTFSGTVGYPTLTGVSNAMIPVPIGDLTDIYINFGGHNFPANPYHLVTTGRSDWVRAYEDYRRYSQSHVTGEENIIKTLKEYMQHPVFVFQVKSSVNTFGQSTLTIYTNGTNPANTEICTTVEYVKELAVQYNEGGVPSSTQISVVS
jgi:hypothetical protein